MPHLFLTGKFGSQTLQFTITVYAVSSESVVSPFMIILEVFGFYVLRFLEIKLEMAIEMARAADGAERDVPKDDEEAGYNQSWCVCQSDVSSV